MSANLLQNPGKLHTLTDDLESFLHVLAWMMLRFVPTIKAYDAEKRHRDMQKFDEHFPSESSLDEGGMQKADALGRGVYPSIRFQPKEKTPLFELLRILRKPFKSLYAAEPPTDEDRNMVDVPKSQYDQALEDLSRDIRRYDEDIKLLDSSYWFINTMQTALDWKGKWPYDDKAEDQLVKRPGATKRQNDNLAKQIQHSQNLMQRSRGLQSSSKRAASPTPESERSAKRYRVTPPVSRSGI